MSLDTPFLHLEPQTVKYRSQHGCSSRTGDGTSSREEEGCTQEGYIARRST